MKYDDRIRCAAAPGELTEARRRNWTPASSRSRSSFDEKRVRGCFGGRDRAKVLPEMRRTKDMTDKDDSGASYHHVRWEVWSLHKPETMWVDARVFLFASA